MSEMNGSLGAVIIVLLNAFEHSAILTVSYVICKASIGISQESGALIMRFIQKKE